MVLHYDEDDDSRSKNYSQNKVNYSQITTPMDQKALSNPYSNQDISEENYTGDSK